MSEQKEMKNLSKKGWQLLSPQLDEYMPRKKKRLGWILLPLSLALSGIGIWYLSKFNQPVPPPQSQELITKLPVSNEMDNQLSTPATEHSGSFRQAIPSPDLKKDPSHRTTQKKELNILPLKDTLMLLSQPIATTLHEDLKNSEIDIHQVNFQNQIQSFTITSKRNEHISLLTNIPILTPTLPLIALNSEDTPSFTTTESFKKAVAHPWKFDILLHHEMEWQLKANGYGGGILTSKSVSPNIALVAGCKLAYFQSDLETNQYLYKNENSPQDISTTSIPADKNQHTRTTSIYFDFPLGIQYHWNDQLNFIATLDFSLNRYKNVYRYIEYQVTPDPNTPPIETITNQEYYQRSIRNSLGINYQVSKYIALQGAFNYNLYHLNTSAFTTSPTRIQLGIGILL